MKSFARQPPQNLHPCCATVPVVSEDAKMLNVMACDQQVDGVTLMCGPHWAMVDGELRRRLVQRQRIEKARGLKEPSILWRELAKEAVLDVWRAQIKKLESDMKAAIAAKQAAESSSVVPDAPKETAAEAPPRTADEAHG